MPNQQIHPERITRPFQLLATVLLALVIIEGELIYATLKMIKETSPIASSLALLFGFSSILFIPHFLKFIFTLLTKYREEMQEDKYFHQTQMEKYKQMTKIDGFKYKKIKINED